MVTWQCAKQTEWIPSETEATVVVQGECLKPCIVLLALVGMQHDNGTRHVVRMPPRRRLTLLQQLQGLKVAVHGS